MAQVTQLRNLGASGIRTPALGVGTNRWGASGKDKNQIFQAFQAALDAGTNLIDTAELYTGGKSERLIGEFTHRDTRPVIIFTKFAPLLRLSAHQLLTALDASLDRLGEKSVDLYLVHFPYTVLSIASLMDAMAQAMRSGKIRAVGVSNYSAKQMREAAARLARHNIPLAANEVHYSLLHRQPETNGVLDACRELNVALIAYFPLGGGLLKARQGQAGQPKNWMTRIMEKRILGKGTREQLKILEETLETVARAHGGTVSQVALNWLLQRDDRVIAIPGATSARHARENAETLTWNLTPEEFANIDQASESWRT